MEDLSTRTHFVPDELEALLKFIPSPQLLKFRSVTKEVDDVAKIVLGKRRDIKLNLTTDNFDSRSNWEFLKFLNSSPPPQFVAPVVHIKNVNKSVVDLEDGKIPVTFQIIGEIIQRLGNRGIIRKLIIEDGRNGPHFTSDFVFTLLSHLPTLETLKTSKLQLVVATSFTKLELPCLKLVNFANFEYNNKDDVNGGRNLLKKIISCAPKLENISSSSELGYGFLQMRALDLIPLLRDAQKLSKIKKIFLTKSTDLDILLHCKPKIVLHSFKFETNDENIIIKDKDIIDSQKLSAFLLQQGDLKSLECDGNSLAPKSIFTLPRLPLLEELDFSPRESGCLLSVNYGRQTPALKTLKIYSTDSPQSWDGFLFYEISNEMPPCLSLEKLDVYIQGNEEEIGRTQQKMFDEGKKLFPNIKKLRFDNPDGTDIQQFSKCWPSLEKLTLWLNNEGEEKNEDLDELLFGISKDWKKEIDTTEEEWWNKIPPPEITRTVANLECLKELKIQIADFRGTVTLSDFAVYFGLRRMNLRKLKLTQYPEEIEDLGLSTDAFDFLVKNLPNLEKLSLGKQRWERGVK